MDILLPDKTSDLPCIFLMGPTASGKTDLAVDLVKQFPCDIISVDSAMVYREMDIGTAKPTADILAQAPHRLIDIRDPSQAYSAAEFCQDAVTEIEKIHALKRIPLLVGGTGLYFRSLQQGLSNLPSAHPEIRERLSQEAERLGWAAMHCRLADIDPQAAHRIHPNDPQRIQRALEVYEVTGQTMTAWYEQSVGSCLPYRIIKLIIAPTNRTALHVRIACRFKTMLEQGLIEEVERLIARGDLTLSLPALRAVGYRQVWLYLTNKLKYEDLLEQGIIATRQLAKRQLTWLRSEFDAHWFDSQQADNTKQIINYLSSTIDN